MTYETLCFTQHRIVIRVCLSQGHVLEISQVLGQTQEQGPCHNHAQLPLGCPAGTHLNPQSHGSQSQVNNVVFNVLQNCNAGLCCLLHMCTAVEIRVTWPGAESNV